MEQYRPILKVLNDAGHQAFFVGGCVRDRLLGRPSKDVDITTSATPEQVAKIFPDSKLVGAHFGVTIIKYGDLEAEVATFRTDGCYSDARRPDTVTFTRDVGEDLERRDFTINALIMNYNEVVEDLTVNQTAFSDLRYKTIRCVGDPDKRFAEDALRMLRAVRFAAQLEFKIEPKTFQAIEKLAATVMMVSQERIKDELSKILTSGQAGYGFHLLRTSGLLQYVLPKVAALSSCPQNPAHHPEGNVWIHTCLLLAQLKPGCSLTLALAALLHDVGKPGVLDFKDALPTAFGHEELGAIMAADILRGLKFPNDVTDTVVELVAQHMRFRVVDEMRKSKLYRFLRQPNFTELLELHRMDALAGRGNLEHYNLCVQKLTEVPVEVLRPTPLLTGADLIAYGLQPGPIFRRFLKDIETLQLEGIVPDRETALKQIPVLLLGYAEGKGEHETD